MRLHYPAIRAENEIFMSLEGKGLAFCTGGKIARKAQVRANREGRFLWFEE